MLVRSHRRTSANDNHFTSSHPDSRAAAVDCVPCVEDSHHLATTCVLVSMVVEYCHLTFFNIKFFDLHSLVGTCPRKSADGLHRLIYFCCCTWPSLTKADIASLHFCSSSSGRTLPFLLNKQLYLQLVEA